MDFEKIDYKTIWTFLILVSIGAILACSYLIISSFMEAKRECENLDGDYTFDFPQDHLCDGRKFIKYESCQVLSNTFGCKLEWVFEDSIEKIKFDLNNISSFKIINSS